jgi:NADPH-dependent 2,4-dienoyl-CoA reductase/sulfur reductase-like enzyme/nitrite reductase/ring-hydroxylating ferredoxin subunit
MENLKMTEPNKPDLKHGLPVADLGDGKVIAGIVGGEDAMLARRGDNYFAVGSACTHYHGPLNEGLIVNDTVRCPWHHACFSLRTGEALRAPALDPISCWRVEVVGGSVYVREKVTPAAAKPSPSAPASVVIVGGGAAGLAAAEMLRRKGYAGPVTMISADSSAPVDRPNLSKDYLAGNAPEDWIPLRPADFYRDKNIDLILNARVSGIDVPAKRVQVENGASYEFGALLLATGADPVRLPIEGATGSQIHYLRTFADSQAIVKHAEGARQVVVVGASFIGLEVAASLRARNVEVHVVAPERQPLERVMGPEVGQFVRKLHESHGVIFHLEQTVARVAGRQVTLKGGDGSVSPVTLDADFLVLGVGVKPSLTLAEKAGLAMEKGILVNQYLETSTAGIFAAGDAARWPDPHSGEKIRVEHWVVAERQGQSAAKNILGLREMFDAVPFFWSQHYDVAINYIGHAEHWDAIEIDGNLDKRDCAVKYRHGGRTLAVVTIGRDQYSLQVESEMEAKAR